MNSITDSLHIIILINNRNILVIASGKTHWVSKFLDDRVSLCNTAFDRIIFLYRADQPIYDSIRRDHPGVVFIRGVPDSFIEQYLPPRNALKTLLIIDDLQEIIASSPALSQIFTVHSHHSNCSVLITLQQLFCKAKFMRKVHLQVNVYVLMRSVRDICEIRCLARQLGGTYASTGFIVNTYRSITRQPHFSYLVLDLQHQTPDKLRLRSDVFRSDPYQKVFVENRMLT